MSRAIIRIYRENGGISKRDRTLIQTRFIESESAKRLTSKRAGRILANEFPEYESKRNGMIKIEEGWFASRTIQPTEKCSFHYIWEYAVVMEDS